MIITPPNKKLQHNNYIAIAKALGIICIVVWHARPPYCIGYFVMLFAVPLFFFTSGYFYKPSKTLKDIKTFYIKRLKGLYLPFIKWSLLFLVLHNVCYHLNIYNDQYGFYGQTSVLYSYGDFGKRAIQILLRMEGNEQLLGAFWFIRALFISSLLVATVQFMLNKWKFINRFVTLCLLLPVTIVVMHYKVNLPLIGDFGLILFSTSFYVLGYCYHSIERKWFYTPFIAFLSSFVTFFGLVYFNFDLVEMLGIKDSNVLPYFIIAFSGIIMVLNISKLIEHTSMNKFFYYIGNNTMIILALHFTCFKIVSLTKITLYSWPIERLAEFPVIEENNLLWWIVYAFVGVSIPILLQTGYDHVTRSCCHVKAM